MCAFDGLRPPDAGPDDDARPAPIEMKHIQASILHGQICSDQGEMGEPVRPSGELAVDPFLGVKALDLPGHLRAEFRRVEQGNAGDAIPPGEQSFPEILPSYADRGDSPDAAHDHTMLFHGEDFSPVGRGEKATEPTTLNRSERAGRSDPKPVTRARYAPRGIIPKRSDAVVVIAVTSLLCEKSSRQAKPRQPEPNYSSFSGPSSVGPLLAPRICWLIAGSPLTPVRAIRDPVQGNRVCE